jgi:hypothetical protein
MRQVFARLLRDNPPGPNRNPEGVSRVLRRTEEARIHHWHRATKKFPPRRGLPDG